MKFRLLVLLLLSVLNEGCGFSFRSIQPHSRLQAAATDVPVTPMMDESSPTTTTNNKFLQSTTAGMTVALAMIPEAVGFAFVAGVSPLVGLWTTVVLGFVAAVLGGRPGIMSSASGAVSVVLAALCASHGPAYLSACAILAGLLQMGGGALGWGQWVRLVPHPVMLGFVNGLALVMTRAQLVHLGGLTGKALQATVGLAAATMGLCKLIPLISKVLPSSLIAVTLVSIASRVWKLPVKTLADVAGASTFVGGWSVLPSLGVPKVPLAWSTLQTILPYAITMAAVGSIESLLTMQLLDNIVDDGKQGSTQKEMTAQGAGNLLSGLFGGIGGCALLGQSMISVQSGGGVSRWSGMSMAIFLATGIVLGAPLLASVPIASLVGVMLLVCQSTFSWSSLRLLSKIPRVDAAIIALVTAVTVQKDLALAVVTGTIISALNFAWKQSADISVTPRRALGRKKYDIAGSLFFGSTGKFSTLFDAQSDPETIDLVFDNCKVWDPSACEAIHSLVDKYGEQGKTIYLKGLTPDAIQLLKSTRSSGEIPIYMVIDGDVEIINPKLTFPKQ